MGEYKEPLYYIKLGCLYIGYISTSSECVDSNLVREIDFRNKNQILEKYKKQDAEKLIKIIANTLSIEEKSFEIDEVEENE